MHHNGTKVLLNEQSREYIYFNSETKSIWSYKVEKVVELSVSPSQFHYLTTADGRRLIIKPDWFAIEIVGPWAKPEQVISNAN